MGGGILEYTYMHPHEVEQLAPHLQHRHRAVVQPLVQPQERGSGVQGRTCAVITSEGFLEQN